nr:radical SAM protein [uncultured Anaerosporobacter sp.]
MHYDTIGITIGTYCNANCSICCMSNEEKTKIDIEKVEQYIQSTKNYDKLKNICFTGGEVMCYYDELIKLISLANNCGKTCGIITNGYWGKDLVDCKNKIKTLRSNGLKYITLSYDEFHEKYIPIKSIINIIQASKELDVKISIQSVTLKNTYNSKWISQMGAYLEDVNINFVPCMPTGNAKECIDTDEYPRLYEINGLKCRKSGSFSITSDGKIWPCCSAIITETALVIDYLGYDIVDTINKLQCNVILYALRNYGFDFFIDIAERELNITLPKYVISSCELCSLLFSDKYIEKMYAYTKKKLLILN